MRKRWLRGFAIILVICMTFSCLPVSAYAAEDNADLNSIECTAGALTPSFETNITEYDLLLPVNAGEVTITASKADADSSVSINSEVRDSISLSFDNDEAADTIIEVTGHDGITKKSYTVHVSRPANTNADLSMISTTAGTLSPAFDANTTAYTLVLPYDISSAVLSVTKTDINASVAIDSTAAEDATIELAPGEAKDVTIIVTAQDGTSTKTYTVTARREVSANANLASLNISAGTLTPVFDEDVTDYSVVLEENLVGVAITPGLADETATIKINGATQDSLTLMLNNGETKDALIEVTAADETTKKTYTVHVSRNWSSSETNLANLTLTDGYLYPTFVSSTLSYKGLVSASQESVVLKAVLQDKEGQVTIGGTPGAEKEITIGAGETKQMQIKTTSRDGLTTKTYTVSLYRMRPGDPITIESGFFSPNEVIASTDSNTIYLRDNTGKRIFSADMDTGEIRSLSMPYTPYTMMYMAETLLVVLSNPKSATDTVAVIDPDTFTVTHLLDVDMDLKGAYADADYIYAYNSYSTYAYARSTWEKSATNSIGWFSDIELNPATGYFYATNGSYTYSFQMIDGQMSDIRKTSAYKGGSLSIMPDGQHLVLNGVVLKCSTDSSQDLQYISKIVTSSCFAVDAQYSELYVVYDRLLHVYDASSFETERVVPITSTYNYLFYTKSSLVGGRQDSSNNYVFEAINTGSMLKSIQINGEPFSEFYPMQTAVNKGEVPYAMSSAEISAIPAQEGAVVTGDTGTVELAVGANTFHLTVTDVNGASEQYTLNITRRAADTPVEADGRVRLGFTPLDVAYDTDMHYAYMTEKDGYSLYRVNLETGEITRKEFDLKAERLALKNGKIYLTLLRSGHNYCDGTNGEGYGAFAVINENSFQVESIFNTNIDPYDIEADSQGYVFLAPGSNQWSYVACYHGGTGAFISGSSSIYYSSCLLMNPVTNKLYSSYDFTAFEITNGVFTSRYLAASGSFSPAARISTDGEYIFNTNGYIYTSSAARTEDLLYSGKISKPFTSICFDLANDKFFTAKDNTLTAYNYSMRDEVFSYTVADEFISMQHNGSRIVALQKKSSGEYYIDYLDDILLQSIFLDGMEPDGFDTNTNEYAEIWTTDADTVYIDAQAMMESSIISGDTGLVPLNIGENTFTIHVNGVQSGDTRTYTLHITRRPVGNANLSAIQSSAGAMSPSFSAETFEFDLLLDKDTSSAVITPVLSDSAASLKIDDSSTDSKTVNLKAGQQQDVTIDITAADGYTTNCYTVHVKRLKNAFTVELPADFSPNVKKISPDGQSVFMTCANQNLLYKADCTTGEVTAMEMPGIVKKIGFVGDELLVQLSMPEFNELYVGLIDPDTLDFIGLFQVDKEFNILTGDAVNYYLYASGYISVYSRETQEKLSETRISDCSDLKVNPKTGFIYVCGSYGVKSYGIVNGLMQPIGSSGYSASTIEILPDGRHLMMNNGTILACSTNKELDLQYTGKVVCGGVYGVDTEANEIYVADDRQISVYNATDFNFKRIVSETSKVAALYCAGGQLVLQQTDASGVSVFRSVNTSTLLKTLKIDGDAFSEFYPAHTIIDRGDVPNAVTSIDITAEAANPEAIVTGAGTRTLSVGENVIDITVADPDSGNSETYYLTFNREASGTAPAVYDARVKLPFTPFDVAIDPGRPVEYMTAVGGKSLYRVNYETGEITEKKFDLPAGSITVKNGYVYVALHRNNDNTDGDGYGAVAVLDTVSLNVTAIINVNISPYDIEADTRGNIYIAPGTSQWSIMAVYDSLTGRKISAWRSVRQQSKIDYNASINKLYSITTESSPCDIDAYEITDGIIIKNYDSPYHGDYSMFTNMRISPDGKYIFNGSGNIFACMPTQTDDMKYVGTLGSTFTSICFKLDDNVLYTGNGKTFSAFNYDTRLLRYKVSLAGSIVDLQYNGAFVTAVMKKNNGDYYVSSLGQYEDNANLSGISATSGVLAADFNENTLEYTLTYNEPNIIVTPVKAVELQTIKINGQSASSIALALNLGESADITVEVTAANGITKKVYTVHVIRACSTNASLSGLTSSYGALSPTFDKNTYNYTVNLTLSQTSTRITPTPAQSKATVKINGQVMSSYQLSLSTGASGDLLIEVTAEDGTTKKVYNVHVARASSNSAALSGLTSSSGSLSPAFNSSTYAYNVALSNKINGTTISPYKSDAAATVRIDGEVKSSKYIAVNPGDDADVTIEVTAQDGVTKKTYTVHISRSISSDATLSGLATSSGTLSPSFNSATSTYSITLANSSWGTTISPSKADSTATLSIDGEVRTSKYIAVNPGESKDVTVKVVAQDGISSKNYTLHITREVLRVTKVTLSVTSREVFPGEDINITASISPFNASYPAVTWTSSNMSVASVDQTGKVTAKSLGSATITATADGISGTCAITVLKKPVTSVSLSSHEEFMYVGNAKTLTAAVSPSDATYPAVTWSSSNNAVATVNSIGLVSAVGEGTATITATADEKSDSCNVTVSSLFPTVKYQSHVQNIGWQSWKIDGGMSGTSGQSLRLEAMRILLENASGGIEYRTHVQNIGWMGWVSNGSLSGTEGLAYRLEAIEIRLAGDVADQYDVYYRVHAEGFGWLGWAKNGQSSGTAGYGYRLEAIEVKLMPKGEVPQGTTIQPFVQPFGITYQSHVQSIGWQDWKNSGEMSGTSGQALRLEAMRISLQGIDGGIEYRTHVQNIGWMNWVRNGALSGTSGLSYRLEAINIRLTGNAANQYDVYYRVHAQNVGWMGWAKNGEASGTAGFGYRLEGIEIRLVAKGSAAPGSTSGAYIQK